MKIVKLLLLGYLLICTHSGLNGQTKLQNGFQVKTALKAGESHLYELELKKGAYAEVTFLQQGVDIDVTLLNAKKDSIGYLDSPNGVNGPEKYELLASNSGRYYFKVSPLSPEDEGLTNAEDPAYKDFLTMNQGAYSVEKVMVMSAKDYKAWQAELKARRQRIIDWLGENSHTLKSMEAGKGFEDLQWLKPVLKDVSIVGLGEATHGTREFFQMKHRMLEFLVREMDFQVFAIEASYPACQNINNYVLNGIGTKEEALASQGFWTWDTEEVLDMIEWIRNYNLTVPTEKRVQFLGYDVQVLQQSQAEVDTFLVNADTALSTMFRYISTLSKSIRPFGQKVDTAQVEQVDQLYNELLADVVLSEGRLVHTSSATAYRRGLEHLRILIQGWRTVKARIFKQVDPEMRDYYMGDNILYLRSKLQAGTKMVVWAHNSHVAADPTAMVNGGIKPMGAHLRDALGDTYYSIAFAFNQGGFQAFSRNLSNNKSGLKGYTVGAADPLSLEGYFAQTGKKMAFLDLRQPLPKEVEEYFQQDVLTFATGAMFFESFREIGNYRQTLDYTRSHDAIIFVEKTTRALPSEKIKKRMAVE